jgi:uncharacterized protein (UPF0332 family)
MNEKEARQTLVKLWLEKAEDAIVSAELELNQGHLTFAVNRLYYACFYAVTAVLQRDGKQFRKHSAVKAEFARAYLKTGLIDAKWHKFYQKLFDDRQEGDYIPTVVFDKSSVAERLAQAKEFVSVIRGVIAVE